MSEIASPQLFKSEPLGNVLITADLDQRPSRAPDYERQAKAQSQLADSLAEAPDSALQALTDVALLLCDAGSAGISLADGPSEARCFRWAAVSGDWKDKAGGLMPIDASPCGVVIDRNAALLFSEPQRHFEAANVQPAIAEILLVPFHIDDQPAGTLWAITHDPNRRFDKEDVRLLLSLSRFASAIVQATIARDEIAATKHELIEQEAVLQAEVTSAEQRNRQVLDSAIDYAIVATDPNGRVTSWNEGARRVLGWTEEEMLGETVERFFTPEDMASGRVALEMKHALETGRGNDERWHLRKSGERFWAQGEMTVLRDEANAPIGFVKVLRDRTEQHEAKVKLEASDARFQLALDSAGFLGSWDWDVAADRIYADAQFAEFYSVPAEDGEAGLPLATFVAGIHPDDRAWVSQRISDTVATCGEFDEEYRLKRAYGREFWVAARGRCICDADGKPKHFPGVAVDITSRKAMEDALRASETRTRLAIEATDMGVWQTTPDLEEQQWDARTRVLLAHDPDEKATFASFLERVHPADRERVDREVAVVAQSDDGILDIQYRVVGRDNAQRWVHVRGRLFAESNKPTQFIGTVRDITPQKVAEEHTALLTNELNHRIKNTLAVVQSIVSQTLRRAETPELAADAIGERLGALARAHDLLTQTSWAAAPLSAVISGALGTYGAQSSRVVVDGPELRLNAKAALAFSMAMHELVTNAAKYGALSNESGRIEVRWNRIEPDEDERLEFVWQEMGGPEVTPPERTGFGSRLMKGLARDLGGHGQAEYRPGGLCWTLLAKLSAIEEPLAVSAV